MIILAMSANAFVDDEFVCLQSGMDGFMHKPVVPNVFYATLLYWPELYQKDWSLQDIERLNQLGIESQLYLLHNAPQNNNRKRSDIDSPKGLDWVDNYK